MKAEKDKKTGKWLIQYRYTDWQGKRRKSTKRGFATKREAEEWLRNFLITQKADFDMKFADFWKMYCADMETRLREHTMRTKKYIVELKILPYFGNKRVNDITAADIRQWQNELIKMGYSPTYLKTINNQLSAIFNYAVRYYDLKNNPFSRRIMTNIYVHQDLHEMNLYPCAYSMTFNVTKEKGSDKLTLNGILNQRSQDVLAANNWNVCQYAVLLHMLAQVCDMQVGEFVHVIADAHIYDRHISLIEELISRETHPAPKFWLNPEVKDFYQFTPDDVRLDDYVTGPQIKNIPIAV